MALRIAIAGFQHETNTFAPHQTGFEEFERADSWPGLLQGAAVVTATEGLNLPIAGFIEAAGAAQDISLIPILWCAAEPGGPVTRDAFDRISAMILAGLYEAEPLDGIYLDLHGAMVTETEADGEAALLSLIRAELGDLPLAVSLDLHANISQRLVDLAGALTIFRTYPHLDMAETGARCLPLLRAQIQGRAPAKAFRQTDFLIPLHAQFTGAEPCQGLYRQIADCHGPGVSADLALGFTAADTADTGPALVAHAPSQEEAETLADDLLLALQAAADRFDCRLWRPNEAVREAMAAPCGRPVVLADVQDNPGAGASSDSTGLLAALIEEEAQGALLGLLADPEIAAEAHRLGECACFTGDLGGKSGLQGQVPLRARFRVETLSDGEARYTGEMYGGGIAILGPSAVLRAEGAADIRVVVTTFRSQCLDLGLFTHFGLEPAQHRILAVKSTLHYRAAFDPIAARTLSVAAPGGFPCHLPNIRYRNLRPGMRRLS